MDHIETSNFSFDETIVSDLHKAAHNVRPSSAFWSKWQSASDQQKQAIWYRLLAAHDVVEAAEIEAEKAAEKRWQAHIQEITAVTGGDRVTAIRWSVQAEDLNNDAGHYCYRWGLPFSMEKDIQAALSAA